MTFVMGIDGGATKTTAVVMDNHGQMHGRSQSGPTNWNSVGLEKARDHLCQAVQGALAKAGLNPGKIDAVCVGASGVDRPHDRAQLAGWLRELFPSTTLAIHNDAIIALASGTGGEVYGVVLISGTGMIVYGFDRTGHRQRAGGWGALLGDPGSGYAIGAAMLKAVTWASDGRGPETTLGQAVLDHLNLARPQQLIDWAYRDIAWERFAALAPLAIQCAEAGDAVAREIVEDAATGLAIAVHAVVQNLGMQNESFPLVLAGGLLHPGLLQDKVQQQIRVVAPKAEFIRPHLEPAVGAALLALRAYAGA